MEIWKEIRFEFDTVDKLDVAHRLSNRGEASLHVAIGNKPSFSRPRRRPLDPLPHPSVRLPAGRVERADGTPAEFSKLPMFGETDVDLILGEAEACHQANPDDHGRLVGR